MMKRPRRVSPNSFRAVLSLSVVSDHGCAAPFASEIADPGPAAGSALRRNSHIRWPRVTTPSISVLRSGGILFAGKSRMSHANPQQTPHLVPFPDVGPRPKLLDRARNAIGTRHYSGRPSKPTSAGFAGTSACPACVCARTMVILWYENRFVYT